MVQIIIATIYALINVIGIITATNVSALTNPRFDSKLYDIKIGPSNDAIRNVGDFLVSSGLINATHMINSYKLLYTSSPVNISILNKDQPFVIDSNTGDISLNLQLTNESLLKYLCLTKYYCECSFCLLNLNIIYSTASEMASSVVRVFVDESNQYAPEFYEKTDLITINVSESTEIGETIRLVNTTAFDLDLYYNQIVYYLVYIDENSAIKAKTLDFYLNPSLTDPYSLEITINTSLDYEAIKFYEFYLVAEDNGLPSPLRNSKRLRINIIDENDNQPVCEKNVFNKIVYEKLLVKNLLKINAYDADSGLNGFIEYKLKNAIGFDLTDQTTSFYIDINSGLLSITNKLTPQVYTLTVKAEDRGVKMRLKTFCKIEIEVLSEDRKFNTIEYLNETSSYDTYDKPMHNTVHVIVNENNNLNKNLVTIQNYDDTNENVKFVLNDTVYFDVVHDAKHGLFNIIAKQQFDYETRPCFYLNVTMVISRRENEFLIDGVVFKNLNYTHRINRIFQIDVENLNDNKPEFTSHLYEFNVDENEFNVTFKNIDAYDYDGSDIFYKILEPYADEYVSIIFDTNDKPFLYLHKPFDYEIIGGIFEYHIKASDSDGLNDITRVVIHIRDVNDNPPIILTENKNIFINEASPVNTFICQVKAIDYDSNSNLTFSLTDNDVSSMFDVNTSNGAVLSKSLFDLSFENFYEIEIVVSDGLFKVSQKVHVEVKRINKQAPYFLYPHSNIHFMHFKLKNFNSTQKLFDTRVHDSGNFTEISYDIIDTTGLLEINRQSGTVWVNLLKTNVDLLHFKQIIDVRLTVIGDGVYKNTINFTLYLNYNFNELPSDIGFIIKTDLNAYENENTARFSLKSDRNRSRNITNFLRLVSDSVLIMILMVCLAFMILTSCIVFGIVYKKKPLTLYKQNCSNHADDVLSKSCMEKIKICLKGFLKLSSSTPQFGTSISVMDASISETDSNQIGTSNASVYGSAEHMENTAECYGQDIFERNNLKRINSIISICYHVPTNQKHICIDSTSYRLEDPNINRKHSSTDQQTLKYTLGSDF